MGPFAIDFELLPEKIDFLLVWIGFGAVIGLLGRAVIPIRDSRETLFPLMLPILGSLFGAVVCWWSLGGNEMITPTHRSGFWCGFIGATLTLLFYHLLGDYYSQDAEGVSLRARRRRRRRYIYEE